MWGTYISRNRAGLALAVSAVLAAVPASGESLRIGGGSSSRMALFQAQVDLLDGKLAKQYSGSASLRPESDELLGVTYNGKYRGMYLAKAKAAAAAHGVPEDVFLKLIAQESGWNPEALSPKGAIGLAQLMPETAANLGVDPSDPEANLDGGARYLRMMFDRFGTWRLALAAYNAGPEAVEAAGGVPDYAETQAYVLAILG
jgi:soluble lytic murein transglycosylase-like protein